MHIGSRAQPGFGTTSQRVVVSRLLAQLPYAPAPRAPALRRRTHATHHPKTRFGRARYTQTSQDTGVWARVALGLALAAAMSYWPYATCGFPLAAYFGGAATVFLAGIWGAVVAWKRRTAWPHVVAVALLLWGVALAGDQILQRSGYAHTQTAWVCN